MLGPRAAPWFLATLVACATSSPQAVFTVPVCTDAAIAIRSLQPAVSDTIRRFVLDAGYIDPVFVQADVLSSLINPDDAAREMQRLYAPDLRNAGVGGTTRVLVLIDTSGLVIRRRLLRSSGHFQLEQATISVADVMRFSPTIANGCRRTLVADLPMMWRTSS